MFKSLARYLRRIQLVVLNRAYVHEKCEYENMQVHWGQCAEDIIIISLLRDIHYKGFYVDVGAHHPTTFSNTYFFYRHGWSGINIDASSSSIDLFNSQRPGDTNINVGVGTTNEALEFHRFECSLLDTFDKDMAEVWSKHSRKIRTDMVECRTLSQILDDSLPENTDIDLLSIDVEGLELDVINSNDWGRFRPKIVVLEQLQRGSLVMQSESAVSNLMCRHDYVCVAIAGHSQYFMRNDMYIKYMTVETA